MCCWQRRPGRLVRKGPSRFVRSVAGDGNPNFPPVRKTLMRTKEFSRRLDNLNCPAGGTICIRMQILGARREFSSREENCHSEMTIAPMRRLARKGPSRFAQNVRGDTVQAVVG